MFVSNNPKAQQLYDIGLEVNWINCATVDGHLDLLIYCYENNRGKNWKHALSHAVTKNHLDVIEWLVSKNLRGTENVINSCVSSQVTSIELLIWLHQNNFEGDVTTLSKATVVACKKQSTKILKWLLDNGYGCNGESLVNSIKYDKKDLLITKWLLNNKVYYKETAFDKACELGKFNVVKFLYENTDVKCTNKSMYYAVMYNFLTIVKFLHMNIPNSYCKQKFDIDNESVKWLTTNKNSKQQKALFCNLLKT